MAYFFIMYHCKFYKLFIGIFLILIGTSFANDLQTMLEEDPSMVDLNKIPEAFEAAPIEKMNTTSKRTVTDFKIDEADYIVGPGDQFEISIENRAEIKTVNPEGKILFNKIGIIDVEGSTLHEAKKNIVTSLKKHYHIARIFASLHSPRTVRVFVTGAVSQPGIYEAPATHRVTDLLMQAKWFRNDARKSEITVRIEGEDPRTVKIKEFLVQGRLKSNPYIQSGAVIHAPFIDYSKPTASIRFQNFNVQVQIDEGETVSDLLHKFYSYRYEPPRGKILLHEPDEKKTKMLDASQASSIIPSSGSLIEISQQINEIYVGGAVLKPGFISYNANTTVSQYIAEAGLISTSKLTDRVLGLRAKNSQFVRVGLEETLKPGDAVIVKENLEKKFTTWAPILLSVTSVTFAILTLIVNMN